MKADLIKLAPTLSAKERYKILVSDFHRTSMGEKPMISESELQAILDFEGKRAVWEEYTKKIAMIQWARILWQRDMETERLRAFYLSLLLNHDLREILWRGGGAPPEAERAEQFENLKKRVLLVEECSVTIYVYPEAIKKIEEELYGIPLFNEKEKEWMEKCYETIDERFESYNEIIRALCDKEDAKVYMRPIVNDVESYLVKKPIIDPATVERIINEIRRTAESEVKTLE